MPAPPFAAAASGSRLFIQSRPDMRILRPALKQLSLAGGHADARVAGPERGMMAFGTYLFIVGGRFVISPLNGQ
jgi:hypothetical protein